MADSLPYATLIHMLTLKLSSTNYLLWKTQVQTLLQSQGLFGFLDGTKVKPSVSSSFDAEAIKAEQDWITQDQRLHSLLLSSLTEESMAHTLGSTSAASVWSALEKVYSLQSKSREIQLKDDLQNLRRGSSSVEDYSNLFVGLCHKLAAIKCSISDTDKLHWYHRGLGPAFSHFSLHQIRQHPTPLLSDVISEAKSCALFQKSLEEPSSSPTVAFAASSASASGRLHHPKSSGPPNGRSGTRPSAHRVSTGPRHNKTNRRSFAPRCQICRTEGHFASDCPDRYHRSHSDNTHANLAEAFHSVSLQSSDSPDWYMDSGASSHMTSTSSQLASVSPYSAQDHKGDHGKGKA
ncbi:unnamed protein product [Cuscuta epithymum]|uniref:CCHC-type domain-containing protein n=1 Tax=Cuscuta epithymum TaxID=186058 RepID=A0AAV0FYX7_9ASTE|nr:unnamed protein product [Cuscuta epithymum]